ncbi:MAG: type II toxin-antitoxin system VapC family toxin [Bacteroidales bacterium]|nr:type II toxin-antitoxin system VapC family toxin [Bacteroidales bacterium]
MVVDTNIIIRHFRSADKAKTILTEITRKSEIQITSVTLYELLIGATNEQKRDDVFKIITGVAVLPFDTDSSKIAASIFQTLKAKNKIIEFRDIFIAAICINNGLPLKTLNKKHFDRIGGLVVE